MQTVTGAAFLSLYVCLSVYPASLADAVFRAAAAVSATHLEGSTGEAVYDQAHAVSLLRVENDVQQRIPNLRPCLMSCSYCDSPEDAWSRSDEQHTAGTHASPIEPSLSCVTHSMCRPIEQDADCDQLW